MIDIIAQVLPAEAIRAIVAGLIVVLAIAHLIVQAIQAAKKAQLIGPEQAGVVAAWASAIVSIAGFMLVSVFGVPEGEVLQIGDYAASLAAAIASSPLLAIVVKAVYELLKSANALKSGSQLGLKA